MEIGKKNAYLDEYKIIRTLGSGYHAEVKLGQDLNGQLVAIKHYKKTATIETLRHELSIMKELQHENLVQLLSVRQNATYKTQNEQVKKCFAIVLEYVGGGQLFDFVADTGKFSQKVARTYFHQMMNGLNYMHQKGYAHRDIKPENILLSHIYILKLADFGFSIQLKGKNNDYILKTKLGTEGYMAPQIVNKKYEGKSVDIFAAGVILFIMYTASPPFEKALPNDPYYKLLKDKNYELFWRFHGRKRPLGYFSDSFKDLFQRMVAFDPSERYTIAQIANHPWIKQQICTHNQIKEEFALRQKRLDAVLEERRIQQEKERALKNATIKSQGTENRSATDPKNKQFYQKYNQQDQIHRQLQILEKTCKDDIIIKENVAFVVSLFKENLPKIEIQLADVDEEQLQIGDESEILHFQKLIDQGKDKINVRYSYYYKVDEEVILENVEIEIQFGVTTNKQLLLKFDRIEGNSIYYKKVLGEIRKTCFG